MLFSYVDLKLSCKQVCLQMGVSGFHEPIENASPIRKIGADRSALEIEEGNKSPRKSSAMRSPFWGQKKADGLQGGGEKMMEPAHQMPPANVMTRLILIMVWRKLIRNPNTYSSLIGVVWSLVSFRQESSSPPYNFLVFCFLLRIPPCNYCTHLKISISNMIIFVRNQYYLGRSW